MAISHRDQRQLRGIAKALSAADPHLAAMLAIFARLVAADAPPAQEQIRRPLPQVLWALASLAAGAAATALAAVARAACLLGRCAAAGWRRAAHAVRSRRLGARGVSLDAGTDHSAPPPSATAPGTD